jgi:3-mercaptopyruvate sulfurtransferase SseA
MKLISREELKEKLDRGDKFKLVNALGEWAFNAKHIPGSINISKIEDARKFLDPKGYSKVRRYAGGIVDWEQAGYPLEGDFM